VIDSEGLDDHFFVALTKHFFVDHPGRCPPAHRALDEFHLLTSEQEKGMRSFRIPIGPVWHYWSGR
jgi:hypothetical protein